MAWFSRFSEKHKCFLTVETSQPLSSPAPSQWVAARASAPTRCPRQNLNHCSRVIHTRERPIDTTSSSLLPVRGVEREPTSVEKDTHERPQRATNLHPAGAPVAELLEAQHPSSAHMRAEKFISSVPKHQPLLDALDHGQHSWVSDVGQTNAMRT